MRLRGKGFLLTELLSALALLAPGLAWAERSMSAAEVKSFEGLILIDVRSPSEFDARHIDGAINIPLSRITEAALSKAQPIVLYCNGEGCPISNDAAKILKGKGYTNVKVLEGGLLAWEAKGYPIVARKSAESAKPARVARVSPRALHPGLKGQDSLIIDVRPGPEFASTHVAGSVNVPLEELKENPTLVDRSRPIVVYDRLPTRSQEAAGFLAANGFRVSELAGGISVWAAMKLPLEVSVK